MHRLQTSFAPVSRDAHGPCSFVILVLVSLRNVHAAAEKLHGHFEGFALTCRPVINPQMEAKDQPCQCASGTPASPARRAFLARSLAVLCGGAAVSVPFLAGLGVLMDPLRRKSEHGEAVRVGTLDALPEDGTPVKFPVLADKQDAWNKFRQVPVGAVYIRRLADRKLQAFNVICPHAGCYVDYTAERNSFLCPCHNSTFSLDGKIDDPNSPSPRGMDPLEVELRKERELWVKFRNYQPGRAERIPVA
jgi:menaquinol-cytochrome c reductase iron-sulfur subunit